PDILAVLLTGKPLDEIRGEEYDIARNQVLSYLTGQVGSQLGRGIAGATGLSTVRIEPNLIAAEARPGARLTVGQDITRNLELIYSMDLVNSSDQIYVAEYDITRRFTGRAVRQSDGSFRMDFRHEVRFGGIPEPRRGTQRRDRRIGNVTILGNNYFGQDKLADRLGVESGDRYDFFKLRKRVDKIDNALVKENLLESSVRLRRQENAGLVDLTLAVRPGPLVDFIYEGASVPDGVQKSIRQIWHDGVFDRQRAEEAVEAIRGWMVKEDRLQAQVDYAITTPSPDRKRVTFDIRPGPQFRDVKWVFEGAKGLDQDTLEEVIEKQQLQREVYIAPTRVTELLTRFYQEQGYLDAAVNAPRYELNGSTGTGQVVFPVEEGQLFRVGEVAFEGNTVYSDAELATQVPLPKGEGYRPVLRQNSLDRIRDMYWERGYNDAETDYIMKRSKETGTVDLTFRIAENRQSVVRDLIIEGNEKTSDRLIRTQLELTGGDVMVLQKLGNSRRNLYNTGAYASVEIAREEMDAAEGVQMRARADGQPGEKPIRLRVKVREVQPFRVRYGGFFDTDRGPGAIVDLTNHNSLGSARVLGLRARYDKQLEEYRLNFSQPL
ncbi:MAG TPA: translocation/assembly module TamB domain-containing protein, partial [Bryobacteraceae bacterium]|nr:translocation/assembly module TamB domain-containing protein [Bryobacteraceae bacterium]